jgi:hypothetical protein
MADQSTMALKNIEFQMNKHLKNKFGQKYKKVNIETNDRNMYNADSFGELIDYEIQHLTSTKKWNNLPLYFKWNCVQEYMTDNNIIDKKLITLIKNDLMKNKLNVIYDLDSHKLSNINLDDY